MIRDNIRFNPTKSLLESQIPDCSPINQSNTEMKAKKYIFFSSPISINK